MIIDTLITNRASADVARVRTLRNKGWAKMSEAERAEWLSPLKGAYNAADLNRVGEAVQYLADLLTDCGYAVDVSPKVDWARSDIPAPAQMERYLGDVRTLRGVLAVWATTPAVPPDMDGLTVDEANDIEQILVDVEALINRMTRTVNLGWALGIAHIGLYGGI